MVYLNILILLFLFSCKSSIKNKETCTKETPNICYKEGKELIRLGQKIESKKLLKLGCKSLDAESCYQMGVLIETEAYLSGGNKQQNLMNNSKSYYKRSCISAKKTQRAGFCVKAIDDQLSIEKSIKFYELGCDSEIKLLEGHNLFYKGFHCVSVGFHKKDKALIEKGIAPIRKGCEFFNGDAKRVFCGGVIEMYIHIGEYEKSKKYLLDFYSKRSDPVGDLRRWANVSNYSRTSFQKSDVYLEILKILSTTSANSNISK